MAQGTQVGAIHYDLDLDDSKFKAGMKDARGALQGVGDNFHKAEAASKVFAAAVIGAGVAAVGFGLKAVQAFNESERASAQLEAVIKSTGAAAGFTSDQFKVQAGIIQQYSAISDEAVMAAQSMLSTFKEIKGPIMTQATQAVADLATAMGGGAIPSTEQMRQSSIMLGKALNDPIGGLNAMRRVGIQFTDEQEKQITTLAKSGKTMEAQTLILKELESQFGGSAKAAGSTFAGQVKLARENFGDFMELVGEGIVKSLRPMVEGFNEWFASIGGPAEFMELINKKMAWAKDNWPIIVGILVAGMIPAIGHLVIALAPLLMSFVALAPWLVVGGLIGMGVKSLMENFGGLSGILNALKPILETIGNIFNTFIKPVLDAVWDSIANRLWPALKQLWQTLEPLLMPVLKAIGILLGGALFVAIMAFVGAIWVAVNVINVIIRGLTWLIDQIKAVISWVWNINAAVFNAMRNVYDGLTRPFRDAFNWIMGQVGKVVNKLKDLNPFTRHSPSLVDMVKKGTSVIAREYGAMFDDISSMSRGFTPDVRFAATGPLGGTGALIPAATSPSSPVNVTIQPGAFVGTPGDARAFAEMVKGELDKIDRQRG